MVQAPAGKYQLCEGVRYEASLCISHTTNRDMLDAQSSLKEEINLRFSVSRRLPVSGLLQSYGLNNRLDR